MKTGADLVGHRLALMADNPESLKTRSYAVTARTPDEPYYMWRRALACLPRETEAVRIAPCPMTPSKLYDCSRQQSGIAGTGTNARAAKNVGCRVVALIFGYLLMTVFLAADDKAIEVPQGYS